ncbi:MAG: hypothetical protein Q7V10_02080 [Methanobacteriaceae archaeon]|nr:hypothetical protein [Methanobacteriaceae archaeon]MDO9625996.1 hypothetical protein [Methanobacteriaceae archaeon]
MECTVNQYVNDEGDRINIGENTCINKRIGRTKFSLKLGGELI